MRTGPLPGSRMALGSIRAPSLAADRALVHRPQARQQKRVEHLIGVLEPSQDAALRTYGSGPGKDSARKIEGRDLSAAEEIAMGYAIERIPTDHLAAGIDPGHIGEAGTRHID